MQPYLVQSATMDYSTGRLLFMSALIVAGVGFAVLVFLRFKSKFYVKRD